MTFFTLILIALAALLHALWNLLAKKAAAVGAVFVFAYALAATLVYAPFAIWLLWSNVAHWTGWMVGAICLSALIHLAYSLSLQRGYQQADLSVVYPIARGTGPLLATLGAVVFLHEPVSALGAVGLALVVSGILLIASNGRLAYLLHPKARSGLRWGLQTGLCIAIYTVFDAYSIKVLLISPLVLDFGSNFLRTVLFTPYALKGNTLKNMQGYWGLAVLVGVLSPLSYILILYALGLGAPLSVVAPARELSMMIGTLFGFIWLKERVSLGRLLGCVILVGGVVLLGLSH